MPNTIYDFWLMVYQNSKRCVSPPETSPTELHQQKIVMLTEIVENDESKCAIYFPQHVNKVLCLMNNMSRRQKDSQALHSQLDNYYSQGKHWPEMVVDCVTEVEEHSVPSEFNFNYFCIKNVGILNKNGYTIRKFHCLYHLSGQADLDLASSEPINPKTYQFMVYHYWFPHWPDHRSPENIDVVLDMCIHLLDGDCEQEFNENTSTESSSLRRSGERKLVEKVTVPENQAIINGPIPIIHW